LFTSLTQFFPAGVSPAWAFTALVLAVLVTGIAKSGFGGGVGILAVPLMAADCCGPACWAAPRASSAPRGF